MSSTPHQWHWATLLGFDITTSCLFGLQMFLAYVLMLLVMLYEAWILFAIVAGFIPGVMLSSMIKRKYSSSLCSCPTGDQESLLTSDELSSYSEELAARPRILVATKCEDDEAEARADRLEESLGPLMRISSATGQGLPELLRAAWALVHPPEWA